MLMHVLLSAMSNLELPRPKSRSQYTRGMLINLVHMTHHKEIDSPVWAMFKSDPCVFNEDVGETALSVLARTAEHIPQKGYLFARCSTHFNRVALLATTNESFSTEFVGSPMDGSPNLIDSDTPEVIQTVAFLRRLMTSAASNSLKRYDPSRSREDNNFETDAVLHLKPVVRMDRFKDMNVEAELTRRFPEFMSQLKVPFLSTEEGMYRLWPGSEPRQAPSPLQTSSRLASQSSSSSRLRDQPAFSPSLSSSPPSLPPNQTSEASSDDDDSLPLILPSRKRPSTVVSSPDENIDPKSRRVQFASRKRPNSPSPPPPRLPTFPVTGPAASRFDFRKRPHRDFRHENDSYG